LLIDESIKQKCILISVECILSLYGRNKIITQPLPRDHSPHTDHATIQTVPRDHSPHTDHATIQTVPRDHSPHTDHATIDSTYYYTLHFIYFIHSSDPHI
jgi:hypothetical protein